MKEEGPPDPQLNPARSPGMGVDIDGLSDIEVSREDVTIGDADPTDLTAADTEPVADSELTALLADLSEGDVRDRQRAAIALADRDATPTALRALETAAREDPDADVRQFAVEALGELGGEAAERVAVAALGDDDPWVRAEALVALDHADRERYADLIEERLADDHHAVRRNALIALWKLRGAGVFETAVRLVDDDSDRVREWVATILGDIDDERTREPLDRLADDGDDIVARAAREALEGDGAATGADRTAPRVDRDRFDTPPSL